MALGDTGSEWALFHTAIVEAAVANFGDRVSGAGPGHNPCTRLVVRGAVKLKGIPVL